MEQNQQPQPPVFNPQQPVQQPAPQYQPRVTARPTMDPVEAVKTCLKKFFDFKGRARRSEYWWFILFGIIVSSVFSFFGGFLPILTVVGAICSIVLLIPQLSAMTRRLHDRGHSGWWVFIYGLGLLVVYGTMCAVLYPYADQLLGEGGNMELANVMADTFMESPTAATVMAFTSIGVIILWFVILVFTVKDSTWTENKYGPSPKYQ